MKLTYCTHNWKTGARTVYKHLKEYYPKQEQRKSGCLGKCKLCAERCMVKAGKHGFISASSPEKLLAKLKPML